MIGLKLIQKIKNSSYTSLIEPFIYSNHLPLRQLTIRILLDNPGNIETILEQNLSDRNPKRRGLTEKLLFRINPTNLKIAQKRLTSVDFLERIQAISILADTKDKKIIVKLAPILKDPDISVRKAAIEGMVGIGGKKAKMILRDHMLVETHLPLRKFILSSFNTI